jgi:hypothetical protein
MGQMEARDAVKANLAKIFAQHFENFGNKERPTMITAIQEKAQRCKGLHYDLLRPSFDLVDGLDTLDRSSKAGTKGRFEK